MSWLLASHNSAFTAAFVMLLCFALLEAISLVMGLGISEFLSDLLGLPDHGDFAAETPDLAESPSSFAGPLLSWLEIGKVPVLISLSAFLAAFSISGMALQQILILSGLGPLPLLTASAIAFTIALPVLKAANRLLGSFWPQDETSAFAPALLIGRVGIVTIGTATADRAAELKVMGPDSRLHYVMCFASTDPVAAGEELLIQTRDAATGNYRGTKNLNPDLSPSHYL